MKLEEYKSKIWDCETCKKNIITEIRELEKEIKNKRDLYAMIVLRKSRIKQNALQNGLFKVKLKDLADELKKAYNEQNPEKPITKELHVKYNGMALSGIRKADSKVCFLVNFENYPNSNLIVSVMFCNEFQQEDLLTYKQNKDKNLDELTLDVYPEDYSITPDPLFTKAFYSCIEKREKANKVSKSKDDVGKDDK